jgi:hypothetical protein
MPEWRFSGPIAAKLRQELQSGATKFDFNKPAAYGTFLGEQLQHLVNA